MSHGVFPRKTLRLEHAAQAARIACILSPNLLALLSHAIMTCIEKSRWVVACHSDYPSEIQHEKKWRWALWYFFFSCIFQEKKMGSSLSIHRKNTIDIQAQHLQKASDSETAHLYQASCTINTSTAYQLALPRLFAKKKNRPQPPTTSTLQTTDLHLQSTHVITGPVRHQALVFRQTRRSTQPLLTLSGAAPTPPGTRATAALPQTRTTDEPTPSTEPSTAK